MTLAENIDDVAGVMLQIGQDARIAATALAQADAATKNAALANMAAEIRAARDELLKANETDVARTVKLGKPASFIDRLTLDPDRIEQMAKGLEDIAGLPDPVGSVMANWERPNGLKISRVRVPLGVIGIIFESRPNVTADAGALAMKSGNAAILRGGSDSLCSCAVIVECLQKGLVQAGLPPAAIQAVPTSDRAAVGLMLGGLDGCIDLIVPRGGKSLVGRVQTEARVPVFAHLEGICHVYVDKSADADMACRIAVNAKMRRTGVCGAAECVIVHRSVVASHGRNIVRALQSAGCQVRGDASIAAVADGVVAAKDEDYGHEFLDAVVLMVAVDDIDAAIAHIAKFGSQHTDCIVSDDELAAQHFLNEVDSAIVLHNASTQFADGGEFGFGAEIGIATGKLHARGPVGLEQLTTFKYQVRGSGQTRA